MTTEETEYPILLHLGSEFLLWLWYHSDEYGVFNFDIEEDEENPDPDAILGVDLWVDTRISLRAPDADKVTAVLTGEAPATAPESKAAICGGKVLAELRIGVRANDREYYATLRGPELRIHGLAVPAILSGSGDEDDVSAREMALIERSALIEEFDQILATLFCQYCALRVSRDWPKTMAAMGRWAEAVGGHDGE